MVNFYFWPVKHSNSNSTQHKCYLVFTFLLLMAVQITDLHRLSHFMGEDDLFSEVPCDLCLSTIENESTFLIPDSTILPGISVDIIKASIKRTYSSPHLLYPLFYGKKFSRPPPLWINANA